MERAQINLDSSLFKENDGIFISRYKSRKRVVIGCITRKKVLELITKNLDEIPELAFLLKFIFEVEEYLYSGSEFYIELENGSKVSIIPNASKIFELLTKN